MSLIKQAAASFAGTASKGLISFWARLPADTFTDTGDFIPIIEFGTRDTRTSLIWIQSNGLHAEIWSKPFPRGVQSSSPLSQYADWIVGEFVSGSFSPAGEHFANPFHVFKWRGYYWFNNLSAPAPTGDWNQALATQHTSGAFKPLFDDHVANPPPGGDKIGGKQIGTSDPAPDDSNFYARLTYDTSYREAPNYGTVVADVWNHFIIAWDASTIASVRSTVDATGGITTDLVSSQYLWGAVNDVDISFQKLTINQGPMLVVDPGQILPSGGYMSGGEFQIIDEIGWIRQLNIGDPPQDTEFTDWEADLDGQEIGITTQPTAAFGGKIEMAYFQMWLGDGLNSSLLDTSVESNRRRFVRSDGRPTLWRSAWSDLGTPLYAMRRGAANFYRNEGSGGNFIPVGVINDYSPGPDTGPLT